jgi:copper homeostasis protein (lipoprotein)
MIVQYHCILMVVAWLGPLAVAQRKGSEISMIMRHVSPSSGRIQANTLGALPASFVGELPCADCPGIRYTLDIFPDKSFYLRLTYLDRPAAKPFDDIGRWTLSDDGSTLMLEGTNESVERFAVKSTDILRKLDAHGREIDSQRNYDLRRTSAFERIEPRLAMKGMFRYIADAATFIECRSGQRWAVAMEGEYTALETAYLKARRQPADELLVSIEGQVALRPNVESRQPIPTLVVERYIGIWPGETCGSPFATAPLKETYWKLTRLEDKPVILAEKQREPSLVLRSEQNRVTGFGGCNTVAGSYKLNGAEITFMGAAATRRACPQGMDLEAAFFAALNKVRRWKIIGQHLELYDSTGNTVARFEARALK